MIFFILQGKPTPPVLNNKETEINGCNVNLTWSPPREDACPITMYIIHYREANSQHIEKTGDKFPFQRLQIPSFIFHSFVTRNMNLQCPRIMVKWKVTGQTTGT